MFLLVIIAASKYWRCTPVHGLGGWSAGKTSKEWGEWGGDDWRSEKRGQREEKG